MIHLDLETLSDIGNKLSERVEDIKPKDTILIFKVDTFSFRKIDEDIFYRIQGENKDVPFTPSDDEINLTFPNATIKIIKES